MENTLENKAKFFAQYWGQKIVNWNNNIQIKLKLNILINEIDEYDILELTPLSNITDEDALWIGKSANQFNDSYSDDIKYSLELVERMQKKVHLIDLEQCDYLRSKGYALPYMGLSVETLVEYGWIKLK